MAHHHQQQQQQPLLILKNRPASGSEENRKETQLSNLNAAAKLLPIIRSSLGPKAHQKMLLNPLGGVTISADGYAIVRDLFPDHPITQLIVQGARAQDEEVGDGTTSCVIIASQLMQNLQPLITRPGVHPAYLAKSLQFVKQYLLHALDQFAINIDMSDIEATLMKLMTSVIETKQKSKLKDLICKMAFDALKILSGENFENRQRIDIKTNLRILQIVGGTELDSELIRGVIIDKDVLHPSMARSIENPRILILQGSLEYKKGENQTTIEFLDNNNNTNNSFNSFLAAEEAEIKQKIEKIKKVKPNIVLLEKGCSELASYLLMSEGITAFRRCKMTDLTRLSLASGARICHIEDDDDDFDDSSVGTNCGKFEIKKFGLDYYAFFSQCKSTKSATILLRGPVKDVLAELMRNLQDALYICRSVLKQPKLLHGAGSIELLLSHKIDSDLSRINDNNDSDDNKEDKNLHNPLNRDVLRAIQRSLEIVPQILLENAGCSNVARKMMQLKAMMMKENSNNPTHYGIDGITGEIVESAKLNIFDAFQVKHQIYKTALETAKMIINIDEIVAVSVKKQGPKIMQ